MGAEIRIGARDDAFEVRRRVFIDEQGYENEFDAIDDDDRCLHICGYESGEVVGCARIFPETLERTLGGEGVSAPACALDDGVDPDAIYLLGRVAVLPAYRRRGFAGDLVRASEEAARGAGARVCKLHAQRYVTGLYTQLGYEPISDVDYEDEGQPHQWMAKLL